MSALLARLKITMGGRVYATEERGSTIDMGGADNQPVMDAAGQTHTSEELHPGMIKCTLLVTEGFKVRPVQELKNSTIIAEGNNGLNYIMRNARCGTAREISGGKINATFYGDMEEL